MIKLTRSLFDEFRKVKSFDISVSEE